MAVPVNAAQSVTFTVTADKTEVQPGETVNFTVSMGAVSDLGMLKFKLVIPEGMTYAANSGKIVDGAKDAMNFNKLDYAETSKVVTGASDGTTDYTGTDAIDIATFQCTVNEDAAGTLSVGLTTKNGDFGSMLDDDIDFTVSSTPAVLTVVAATEPPVVTYLLGDADDNGEVETLDCTILQKYLAWMDLDVDEAIVERNGDVDSSGEIETIDITWIQKYLAWYDDIPYPIDEYVTA